MNGMCNTHKGGEKNIKIWSWNIMRTTPILDNWPDMGGKYKMAKRFEDTDWIQMAEDIL
jgi:hypothetical protein